MAQPKNNASKSAQDRYTVDANAWSYIYKYGWHDEEHCKKLRDSTLENFKDSIMCSSAEQLSLFRILLRGMNAKKVIEVGVYTGHATLCLAQSIPEDGKVVGFDIKPDRPEFAKKFWAEAGVADKIDLRICDAVKGLDEMIAADNGERSYDFAFIDADKPNYYAYLERLSKLVRVGGIIAVDNTLWSMRVIDENDTSEYTVAIREFNQKVHAQPERWEVSMLAIGDGVSLLGLKK